MYGLLVRSKNDTMAEYKVSARAAVVLHRVDRTHLRLLSAWLRLHLCVELLHRPFARLLHLVGLFL